MISTRFSRDFFASQVLRQCLLPSACWMTDFASEEHGKFQVKHRRRPHLTSGNNGNHRRGPGRRRDIRLQVPQPSLVPLQCLRHHSILSSYDFTAAAVRGQALICPPAQRLCNLAFSCSRFPRLSKIDDCASDISPLAMITSHESLWRY